MSSENTATALSRLLADSYGLYLKTHNFHWNVVGPRFVSLHQLFEQHYTELAIAVDDIAERIRALGEVAPGSYQEFAALATIQDSPASGQPSAEEMIQQLTADHVAVADTAKQAIETAEAAKDPVSADLATQRATVHEKAAWMLQALQA